MAEDYDIVKSDFDEIALLNHKKWNHNNCYFGYLLKLIPDNCDKILDIGCGLGELSEMLSEKSTNVIAVDLSDVMIKIAKASHYKKNIDYINGNILDMKFDNNSFDIIITTATAHHLPYEWLLKFSRDKLKSSGKLIILDLVKAESIVDYLLWGFASIPNIIMNIIKNGNLKKDDAHSKDLWENHGKHDTYMTIREVKNYAKRYIPNAKITRKLFWRYALVWVK